jgi:hypothetical protein
LYEYVVRSPFLAKSFYVLGGKTASSHDDMTSISTSQREGSFAIPTMEYSDLTAMLLEQVYGNATGNDFPGGAEYNHIGPNEFGPLKDDWSKPCPMSWTRQERLQSCISIQESVWGTTTLAKLEEIKKKVDPSHLFNCFACVGYKESVDESAAGPEDSTTSAAARVLVALSGPVLCAIHALL